jgi:hypothetical protein
MSPSRSTLAALGAGLALALAASSSADARAVSSHGTYVARTVKVLGAKQGARHVRTASATPIGLAAPYSFAGLGSSSSIWRRTVTSATTLDAGSKSLVSRLAGLVAADRAAGRGPWIDTHKCAPPIYKVPAGQPEFKITLDKDNPALQSAFASVPLPSDAHPSVCSDASLALWQPSTNRYWEFWRLVKRSDGWHASWGGATNRASSNPGYFSPADWSGAQSYWGTSATSMTMAGGLITLHDLQRGSIDHALGVVIPETRAHAWSWPAQRTDGWGGDTASNSIPAGAHFRLDPTLKVDALNVPPLTKMIARAAQRYGLYVTDRTHWMVGMGVESPMPYVGPDGANPYTKYFSGKAPNDILNAFPWSRLQLLPMQLKSG